MYIYIYIYLMSYTKCHALIISHDCVLYTVPEALVSRNLSTRSTEEVDREYTAPLLIPSATVLLRGRFPEVPSSN